ncbi:MAG: ATP-binding cassette domain-containing protein [Candidatus Sungbacteria bacterium]|nr:ATP-binding cassette domain-containing protein [Candidatus Sungbacteria bacterium]
METPVIRVKNLKKYFRVAQKGEGFGAAVASLFRREYREVKAVDGIDFDIHAGEMVAFLGPNGAGKTTTLKMLSGILQPTSGEASVLGFNPQERNPEFQRQISLVMGQRNQLWWNLPATDTFLLNKDIYKVPLDQYRLILDELVELLDLQDVLSSPVRKLSLGQRMKCELVASLLHRPKVVFLDEPTIGLDLAMQKKIRAFLKEYNKKYNATIILTSHYMDDVKEVCDRVILINHGRKIYDDQIKKLISEYAHEKYLQVDFENEVSKEALEGIGKVVEFGGLQAVIAVPRAEHAKKAAELLTRFEIDNIDIQEVELEDIILKSFADHV